MYGRMALLGAGAVGGSEAHWLIGGSWGHLACAAGKSFYKLLADFNPRSVCRRDRIFITRVFLFDTVVNTTPRLDLPCTRNACP